MVDHVGEQQRTYKRDESVVFLKTHEEFGELSNMVSGFPITINGIRIRNSEALYQACRYPHMPEVQRLILGQLSPMSAKMKSKPYRRTHSRPDWDNVNIKIMRWCLRVKLAQNWERFSKTLLSTGSKPIVEESKRDPFWGAQPGDENTLVGKNILGRLLMELREQVRTQDMNRLCIVEPPPIPEFLLDGKPIGVINGLESHAHALAIPYKQQESPYSAMPLPFDVATDAPEQAPGIAAVPVKSASEPLPIGVQSMSTTYRKKLIEVALPLEDINKASAREKSIRHGHPSTLHLWWARRPLAACRAVLFGQMVDDPSSLPEEFPTEEAQEVERERLFDIIRTLVLWENTTNEAVLHAARVEIARSAARNHGVALPKSMTPAEVADALKRYAPLVLDPFAGGGSIPLEAQRLGLEAHASDLNPVAVLINKAMIEIPPKFAGQPPVNPESREKYLQKEWRGAQGLAEDVRYYGSWMRDEAFKRIGHLYPRVTLPKEQGGGEATVIAWLWARTVKCPNPACRARMPLLTSFILSAKHGREAYLVPHISEKSLTFSISNYPPQGIADPRKGMKRGMSGIFECIFCGTVTTRDYVAEEGQAKRLGAMQTAVVAEEKSRRIYLPASCSMLPADMPYADTSGLTSELSPNPRDVWCRNFGLTTPADLFTPRQLVALTTFSDLVGEARKRVLADAEGNAAYADAVATYLAFGLDKNTLTNCALATWQTDPERLTQALGRQALPMVWDYAEANPLSDAGGGYALTARSLAEVLERLPQGVRPSIVRQSDATQIAGSALYCIITDPPYYDNIGYADLSDFFYVWLRRTLRDVYPDLFGTLLVPKAAELIATPYRFGGSAAKAQRFFEEALGKAFDRMRAVEMPAYPLTVYYAFKQAESEKSDKVNGDNGNGGAANASTGWETMLEGMLRAGFSIHGTWPMRTELPGNLKKRIGALASSIVLVCRPRPANAEIITRRDFLNALKRELPGALRDLQLGNIAPVDLAQAAIGPGMAVFSRYSKVLESDGTAMRVRAALQMINQTLDEVLAEQEGEFDSDTRFAVTWFEQYGMGQGEFGVADVLARAKDTSVAGLDEAGVLVARGGKVRLLRRDELPEKWNPQQDHRLSVWKVTQRLIQALMEGGGAQPAAQLLEAVGSDYGEKARDLAYRLYTTSERRKWTQEAFAYNTLVTEWHDIVGGVEIVRQQARAVVRQATLLDL